MIKRLFISLAVVAGLLSPAYAAGTINLALTQQIDKDSLKPLNGGKLYFYKAGTNDPQIAYQDTALTIPLPGGAIYTLDATGRIPQFFVPDGQIKVRLINKQGVTQFAADNLLVIGPSGGGGGGGGSVDPTTVLQTGSILYFYGTGNKSGFVRGNGRTIGNASSGATERANADCQALFEFLWGADANLAVSTGRGASANADWVAGKTLTLPDMRSTVLAGMDTMGNTAAGRLTTPYFGSNGDVLGGVGGGQFNNITQANMPAVSYSLAGTAGTVNVTTVRNDLVVSSGIATTGLNNGIFNITHLAPGAAVGIMASTGSFTPAGTIGPIGSGTAMRTLQATMVVTTYLKL